MAFEHAMAQKAGYLLLAELRAVSSDNQTRYCGRELQKCYDMCPWLPREASGKNSSYLPLYLWDRVERRIRKVRDLMLVENDLQYTYISHTWGRKKKNPPSMVRVHGVDWEIPENTLFEVTDLPEILLQANFKTRFIWFDFVFLPQDTSSPEYLSEVSRQAVIFHHASACVAWINTIEGWQNLESAVKWPCLHFLYAGSDQDIYSVAPLLDQVVVDKLANTELIVDSETFALWLSSTWTLQEYCLFPDIILCDKSWQPLEVVPGVTVSLHQLLPIFSLNREAYFTKPVISADWPRAAAQLSFIESMVSGTDIEISRASIMSLGATRECQFRRADAIMSALGVTEWYDDYLKIKKKPPPDKDMVLGSYPLSFVKEAAAKIGSEFFGCFDPKIHWTPIQDIHGSLLPFWKPGYNIVSGPGLVYSWYNDVLDHPSIKTWSINADGSVQMPEAVVMMSSHL